MSALTPEQQARLAEIREREQAATTGPWGVGGTDAVCIGVENHSAGHYSYDVEIAVVNPTGDREDEAHQARVRGKEISLGRDKDDAEFIAASRSDVPFLLGLVAELEGVVGGLHETVAAADADRDRLAAQVAAGKALHAEWKVFQECGHTHQPDEDGVALIHELGLVCPDGYLYSICRDCCRDGDYQSQQCVDHHPHEACWPCDTWRALNGGDRHDA